MSASFRQDGNVNDFIESLIKEHKAFPNISEFSLMILVGISEFWDAFLLFKFNTSFCVSSIETSLKQKFIWAFFCSRIARILGWFLYFRIALIVRFLILSIDESYSLYFADNCTIFRQMYSVSCYNLIGKWRFYYFPKEFIIH